MTKKYISFANLTPNEDELLKDWFGLFGRKNIHNDYYLQMHKAIETGDDSLLSERELVVLNKLLKTNYINRENITDYFIYYDFKLFLKSIKTKLEALNYLDADESVKEYIQSFEEQEKIILKDYYQKVRTSTISGIVKVRLLNLLKSYEFEKSDELCKEYENFYCIDEYVKLKAEYQQEKSNFELLRCLI